MRMHRATKLLGKACVAVDYELTAYWGQVISVSASHRITLKYYAGITKGWQTKEFYHFRVWSVDDAEGYEFIDRKAVLAYFKTHVLRYIRGRLKS